jgi:hypothetical protein
MSIRFPTQTVVSATITGDVGAGSVAGGRIVGPFTLPQDTDNVVMKITSSVTGGTVSGTFQTSDDGGTTWYDVVRTPTVAVANNTVANWASIPTISNSYKVIPGSILGGAIGSAAASVLAANSSSGLPILGPTNRVFLIYSGNLTAHDGLTVQVKANNQSATA